MVWVSPHQNWLGFMVGIDLLDFSVGIGVDLGCVRVEKYLVLVCGSKLTRFLCEASKMT